MTRVSQVRSGQIIGFFYEGVGLFCCLVVDGETEQARAHESGGEGVYHPLVANLK